MSPKKKASTGNAAGTLIALVIIAGIGILYMTTGADPLGIFGGTPTATRTVSVSSPTVETVTETVATETPLPVVTKTAAPVFTVTSEPSWWQVYFVAPQRIRQADEEKYGAQGIPPEIMKGSITEALIQHIDAAKVSIHIASYETDLVDVAEALIRAQKRGVDVRWITDDEAGLEADPKPGHGQFKLMTEAGIAVIDDQRGALMHHKFWLFDSEVVWTGSTNITISGMFEQDNNVIVIESPELAAIYERQFEDMWSGKFNSRSPSTVDQQQVNIDGTAIQILFSPEDKAISRIVPYVQNATKSVYFMAFTYTNPSLGQAMLAKAAQGVTVQGVFETTGSDTEYSQMPPLFCAKVPVRQDGNFAFLHHKAMVIDERYVVTGSLNFTDNADQSNNENVIILDNPEIAKLYIQEFQRVWGVAKDPDPEKIKCP